MITYKKRKKGKVKMKIENVIKELKKGKMLKHDTWNDLIIEYISESGILTMSDKRGYLYYFSEEEFIERFGKFKENWKILSEKEFEKHIEDIKKYEKSENIGIKKPVFQHKKNLSEILNENVKFSD
jgi:hypothetical protein